MRLWTWMVLAAVWLQATVVRAEPSDERARVLDVLDRGTLAYAAAHRAPPGSEFFATLLRHADLARHPNTADFVTYRARGLVREYTSLPLQYPYRAYASQARSYGPYDVYVDSRQLWEAMDHFGPLLEQTAALGRPELLPEVGRLLFLQTNWDHDPNGKEARHLPQLLNRYLQLAGSAAQQHAGTAIERTFAEQAAILAPALADLEAPSFVDDRGSEIRRMEAFRVRVNAGREGIGRASIGRAGRPPILARVKEALARTTRRAFGMPARPARPAPRFR